MNDLWPNTFTFDREVNPEKLVEELLGLPGLGPEPDELGNLQAGARLDALGEDRWVVSYREGVKEKLVCDAVKAHDPTPPAEPKPVPTAIEELNAGIQRAKSLDDVKTAFQDWTDKHRERL